MGTIFKMMLVGLLYIFYSFIVLFFEIESHKTNPVLSRTP